MYVHLWPYLGSLLQAPDFHLQKHFCPVTDCSSSQNLPAWGAGAVKCSLLLQPPLDTMVNSTANCSRQLHMHSVSVVYHLTCRQEPNGVSAWELSLLPRTGLHTKFFTMLSKPSDFLTPGELTKYLAVFLGHHFWPMALGCSKLAPKSAGKSVCWYSAPNTNLQSMACPSLVLQLSGSR